MAKGLGKGIGAFFQDINQQEELVQEIDLKELRPNPYQPRKVFDETAMLELTQSVIEHGILQPIIARKSIKGFQIVAGERRYRAAKNAGLNTVPVIVRDLTEEQMMELAVLENLQRDDLNPLEEAEAYQTLIEQLHLTQEQLAKKLGKSRPHIANYLRILTLPNSVQKMVEEGTLSMGHGRALLGLKRKGLIEGTALKVIEKNLSVREVETLVNELNENVSRETSKKTPTKNIFFSEYEDLLQEKFGTSVKIKSAKDKGKIEIQFFNKEDLERILSIIK
ncbi:MULTISPECIES: ParB/RepB/Spo0J family partition protein [Bacillaceae]|uniref:Chromosome partitioning protein ParB n=1 Tax=Gottfriedia luciferensis TaxID=178774 RepID=A0ABX2ZPY1_9BACI|nr:MULTISPECIES: ParB/RepB/Spo0J family partition protein [Bacillaceae]ODG91793.1 chromosome partitioning protein ParB [Gottfriedia luciferensis]PGZ94496.1 chromosome partitioning protein ParB [Bacillus sp. AFS029533]SFD81394.1 chromosome partitioning protein, ParB family [Bacillus sp. UNCCL81]